MSADPIPIPRLPGDLPDPPEHLSEESAEWWRSVVATYDLRDHHLRLLQAAAEAWDRSQEARRAVADEGPYYLDRFGQPKAHPGLAAERQARNEFRLLVRELGLDAAPDDSNRPPRLY